MFGRRSFPNAFTRLASSFDSPSHRPWGGHGSLRDQLAPVAGKPSGKPREIYGKFTVNLREISGKLPGKLPGSSREAPGKLLEDVEKVRRRRRSADAS